MAEYTEYQTLSRDELEIRAKLAEDVCVMFGWGGVHQESPREKAALELWQRWIRVVGSEFTSPQRHPDLDELERSFEGGAS